LFSLLLLIALGKIDPQLQAKTEFIVNAGRMQPQVSGLLMQADNVFQLECGRALSLLEVRQVYSSPEFSQLARMQISGLGQVKSMLATPFNQFPCKNKGR
jgi:hypothetical protein